MTEALANDILQFDSSISSRAWRWLTPPSDKESGRSIPPSVIPDARRRNRSAIRDLDLKPQHQRQQRARWAEPRPALIRPSA
jgi:hypothetical protein